MDEAGREWEDSGDGAADASKPWLRPVWEDDEDDLDPPPLRRPTQSPPLI